MQAYSEWNKYLLDFTVSRTHLHRETERVRESGRRTERCSHRKRQKEKQSETE